MTLGNRVTTIGKEDFSDTFFKPLLELHDCPKHIHYVGSLPSRETTKYITIVGSRAHSAYAKHALEKLIAEITGYPICVISGLALGIDSLAHKLALEHGVQTIAIPGSGLGKEALYPASNQALATRILQNGGALVSEFDHNQTARQYTFPMRNRLMAALADLVLIVEAGEKSGTLITARLALDYNTSVAVIPNTIFAETARGSNQLISDGASVVLSGQDILSLLNITVSTHPQQTYRDVNQEEQEVLNLLVEPISRNDLLQKLACDTQNVSAILSLLEIKGYIKESLGKIYKI